jgi:hypothetical protein
MLEATLLLASLYQRLRFELVQTHAPRAPPISRSVRAAGCACACGTAAEAAPATASAQVAGQRPLEPLECGTGCASLKVRRSTRSEMRLGVGEPEWLAGNPDVSNRRGWYAIGSFERLDVARVSRDSTDGGFWLPNAGARRR